MQASGIGQAGAASLACLGRQADGQRRGRCCLLRRAAGREEDISPATLYHWCQQAHLTGDLFPDDGAACLPQAGPRSRGRPSRPYWAGPVSPRPSAVLVSATTMPGACPARSHGAEALFRTLKYSPGFPRQSFATFKAFSEATASGWVISTKDAPVCCDTIIPYETGLLAPVQNAKKLADSLQ